MVAIAENKILRGGGNYYADAVTQNYYVRNRDYAAHLGRWLTRDPIGYQGGINLYEYVQSSPVGNVDGAGLAVTVTGNAWHGTIKISKEVNLTIPFVNYVLAAAGVEAKGKYSITAIPHAHKNPHLGWPPHLSGHFIGGFLKAQFGATAAASDGPLQVDATVLATALAWDSLRVKMKGSLSYVHFFSVKCHHFKLDVSLDFSTTDQANSIFVAAAVAGLVAALEAEVPAIAVVDTGIVVVADEPVVEVVVRTILVDFAEKLAA